MDYFLFKDHELYCEDVAVSAIASSVGTPFYLYSAKTLERHLKAFEDALKDIPHITCFAVKANSNLGVLRFLGQRGAGADIVSGGELFRVLRAGIPPEKIVFSGVGKTTKEIEDALRAGILLFNCESMGELEAIGEVARGLKTKAPVSFRVNPDVDPKTHPYISTGLSQNKFGLPVEEAFDAFRSAASRPEFRVLGISCHIGSQLTHLEPFVDALKRVLILTDRLHSSGIPIEYLDMGGGLGIRYNDEAPPSPDIYAKAIKDTLDKRRLTLIIEPGRSIAGNAGILVTKVLYRKKTPKKEFLVVDAAMNDLARPSLYKAYHEIVPVKQNVHGAHEKKIFDVVGPICETGDFFARDRMLPPASPGDLLAIKSVGAYGFTMSSNYNSRPRAAEVMVYGDHYKVVRRRESYEDLIRGEDFFD